MVPKCLRCLAAASLVALLAAPGGAFPLDMAGSSLGLSLGGLPLAAVDQSPAVVPIVVHFGTGGFAEPAGLFFTPVAVARKVLFTGVPRISGLTLTNFGNSTKTVFPGGGLPMTTGKPIHGGGGFGGPGPLSGRALVNILQLFNLVIPLDVVGATSGFVTAGAAGIKITVTGTNWTTGVVQVSGVTVRTPNGVYVNTVTLSGFDNRTPSVRRGQITLISPFHVITNITGNLPGFAIQVLNFPEPGVPLLLGTGALGLALYGLRRLRRG